MPSDDQLLQQLRAIASDKGEDALTEHELATSVFDLVRVRRRRRVLLAGAGAAVLVVVASYAGAQMLGGSAAGPTTPTSPSTSDGSMGHTTLPPGILDLRGEAVGEALDLPRPTSQGAGSVCPDPDSTQGGYLAAEYSDGKAFCVATGNAPDTWLVAQLIIGSSPYTVGLLHDAGVPWDSGLPPPPPVVVDLMTQRLAQVESQYGEDSLEYLTASRYVVIAKRIWTDQADWHAAGWNDHYWGDPWWPTTSDPTAPTDTAPPVDDLTGKAVGLALGLTPTATDNATPCQAFAEYQNGMGFCLDTVTEPGLEQFILMSQIQGYPRTPELIDYWTTYIHDEQLRTSHASIPEREPLIERMMQDKHIMIQQKDALR